MRTTLMLLLLLAAASLLVGCGNKGDLVRPEPEQAAVIQQPVEPSHFRQQRLSTVVP